MRRIAADFHFTYDACRMRLDIPVAILQLYDPIIFKLFSLTARRKS